jgi:anti-sigma factor RsiW
MKCTDVRAALPLLTYGELGPKEEAALKDHLAGCPDCRREQQAFQNVQRLLNAAPVPRAEVDLPRLYQSLADRQAHRLRRWRRAAVVAGAIAALLLVAVGLRLEVRLGSDQLVVRWGGSPAPVSPPPAQPMGSNAELTPETEAQLRVLSELIHALKQDADDREQSFHERLDRLQERVHALQTQTDHYRNATEQDVAALYLLTRQGEKP